MARIGAGASVPPGEPRGGRLHVDDRGQLLILTGVLLVLGFVVIGTTVVQLRGLEDSTSRLERDALLDAVDHVVANFNTTIFHTVGIGETNTSWFQDRTDEAEATLRDQATQAGLFVSIELRQNPDTDIFWRESRCLAYEPAYSAGGVIVGYELETHRETIAGAVYDIHITDGRQTIRMDYYVKVFDCMVQNSPSLIAEAEAEPGTVDNVTGSHLKDDVGLFWVNETLSGTVLKQLWTVPGTINETSRGWLAEENIKTENVHATKDEIIDWIDFDLALPADLQYSHTIPNFTISVHSQHNVVGDDILWLEGYNKYDPAQEVLYTFQVPLPAVKTNTTFTPSPSPEGNVHWTRWDLENITWRLRVQEVLLPDLGRTIKVHYVTANVTWEQPEGYKVVATFDLDKIPPIFDEHSLEVKYRFDQDPAPGVTPETFLVQVYDGDTLTWDTLGTLIDTNNAWSTLGPWALTKEAGDDQSNDNKPRFRIVDQVADDDLISEDRDSIEIDWFQLTSNVSVV